MQHQLCRLCGHRHAIADGHVFDGKRDQSNLPPADPVRGTSTYSGDAIRESSDGRDIPERCDPPRKDDTPTAKPASGVRADWNGYMKTYRARKRLEREADAAELKRLRELVGK